MKQHFYLPLAMFLVGFWSCSSHGGGRNNVSSPGDQPFSQEYSVKYYVEEPLVLEKIRTDRNGNIQILSEEGLYKPDAGRFLYPGTLVPDKTYLPMADKNLSGLGTYQEQFIYLDDQALFGNAWAGSVYIKHQLDHPHLLAGGPDFSFLISDGKSLEFLAESQSLWKETLKGQDILDLKYHKSDGIFMILTSGSLLTFTKEEQRLEEVFTGEGLTCFEILEEEGKIVVGTQEGYLDLHENSYQPVGDLRMQLPWPHLTVIKNIQGKLWFGSEKGAFMLREDGRYDYYFGERWLPGEKVLDIEEDVEGVLVLTDSGFAKLVQVEMTLHEKAMLFEEQVRERHIRYGFNATLVNMDKGKVSTGRLGDSDNDGLWTAMYLGGQAFRYAVEPTGEELQNIRESMAAMERLYSINPVPGFPSRSFARSGYIDILADPERWQHSADPEWDWKATTSSDEAIGHIFAFGVVAELVDDQQLRAQSVMLIDTLMGHILDNGLYLVDYDGQPTTWGRWNPDYVNALPPEVGDRKLNSSNIIAMLQTAYHFTKKEVYRDKAFELMHEHGYLDNLMVPMERIGNAKDGDDWSRMLSESWNHSDDEMYFLGYWGLYRYAFNDSLKAKYKDSIIDHWEAERPEKEGAWNIFTAMVNPENFDREEAIWYLQEYPLDLISWTMNNSHRKDITLIAPNFRKQSTTEVLPPDELRISRHNANRFVLDGGNDGRSEFSAGDIWLLPYWMGRYLGVIGEDAIGKDRIIDGKLME